MTISEALNHARVLVSQQKHAEAEQVYRQILSASPDQPAALLGLAHIAEQFGNFPAAAQLAERAAKIAPTPQALSALGASLHQMQKLPEAEAAFRATLALAPLEPAAYCNLAVVLWDQKRLVEAKQAYQRAAEINPQLAPAWHGLMTVMGDMGDFQEAARAGQRAADLGLNTSSFWSDFAIALHESGNLAAAIAASERAIALNPSDPTTHFNLAQLLLLSGNFERGWIEHEHRWGSKRFPSPRRTFAAPMWDGSPGEKTVLLHAEQGFGDAIMFARYISMAAQRVRVIVECQPELVELMRTVNGAQQVLARDQDPGPIDAHIPFLSLPLVFGTRPETIPHDVPYVAADPMRAAHWQKNLGDTNALKVGVAWAGSSTHPNDVNRSMPIELIRALADVPNVKFFSIQKGAPPADASAMDWLIDHTAQLNDFADTAAFVAALDLVISVDTSIVHLAGALAKAVWVTLPYAPDWRWLVSRPEDSPWYPTMRLFRQSTPRDWKDVVARVRTALRAEAHLK